MSERSTGRAYGRATRARDAIKDAHSPLAAQKAARCVWGRSALGPAPLCGLRSYAACCGAWWALGHGRVAVTRQWKPSLWICSLLDALDLWPFGARDTGICHFEAREGCRGGALAPPRNLAKSANTAKSATTTRRGQAARRPRGLRPRAGQPRKRVHHRTGTRRRLAAGLQAAASSRPEW